jgi:PPIC-type PPIASE domain
MARSRPSWMVSFTVLIAIALQPAIAGAAPAHASVRAAAPSQPTVRTVKHAAARSTAGSPAAPLPDSLLALVGDHRGISATLFKRSWRQVAPPARPDSLTPQAARQFLDLMIDKEALGEMANRETWTWTRRETGELEALTDRLTIGVVLDSSLTAIRKGLGRAGDTLSREAIGIIARDSTVARVHPVFDDSLAERLARAWAALPRPSRDSALLVQLKVLGTMPRVTQADSVRILTRSDVGEYGVSDLLDAWRKLDPIYRPRIETGAQIRDLGRNGLYGRILRREVARSGIDRRPDVVAAIENQREYANVSHLVGREVYKKIATDSVTLERRYRAHRKYWDLPLRVRLIRVLVPDEKEAITMASRLRSTVDAETLLALARRGGADYSGEVSEESDSTLFRAALRAGVGAVLGPTPGKRGWDVARVMSVLPSRGRSYAEVKDLVLHDWNSVEGERLMRALCDRARAQAGVRINDAAVARVAGH